MSKNAITVVDRELIDWFDCHFEKSGMSTSEFDIKAEDLLQMAKDLIEINAELTKKHLKYKKIINMFRDNPEHISASLMCDVMDEIDSLKLKGDSDE